MAVFKLGNLDLKAKVAKQKATHTQSITDLTNYRDLMVTLWTHILDFFAEKSWMEKSIQKRFQNAKLYYQSYETERYIYMDFTLIQIQNVKERTLIIPLSEF